MSGIFLEENGIYQIDCSSAVWATDEIHEKYKATGNQLNDVDFIVETEDRLLLIEYKNANTKNAVRPEAFKPLEDKRINTMLQKYYDTLHYLTLLKKDKPKYYIYILECPLDDQVTRKEVRNRLQRRLPFKLQGQFAFGVRLIDGVEVLNINEWNTHEIYKAFPITIRAIEEA